MTQLPCPLESSEQAVVVQYMELKGIKFSAIPNSTYTTSIKQKMNNKRQGVRAGLPDLLAIVNNQVIMIEMKRRKGGVVSDVQREWHIALNAAGLPTYVCHGSDEAIELINQYLGIETVKTNLDGLVFQTSHT